MKPLFYAVAVLLIGLGNAGATSIFWQFIKDGTFTRFNFANSPEALSLADNALQQIKQLTHKSKVLVGYSAKRRPIHAHFFPGTGTGYALVIGGVHGSELSSIEVARAVIDSLAAAPPAAYNVIVIPELFPDNAAYAASFPKEIGSTKNIGRYSSADSPDPNRQMPSLGSPFLPDRPVDFAGRTIEVENQVLLYLIQNLHPERIASIHAIRNCAAAGVFADPRTDGWGYAHGYAGDSMLAVAMAQHIYGKGGKAPGNRLDSLPSALYHSDPAVAPAGMLQQRTIHGGNSGHLRGFGISLGSWASTGERVYEESLVPRSAAMMFTIEFPGSKRSIDYADPSGRQNCQQNIAAYASAIASVFLQNSPVLTSIAQH